MDTEASGNVVNLRKGGAAVRPSRTGGRYPGAGMDRLVTSLISDVLGSEDIDHLLKRAAGRISAALNADHVAVLGYMADSVNANFCSSIGWNRPVSLRLGKMLTEWSRQPGNRGLADIIPDSDETGGKVYLPPPVFLEQQDLNTGLFAAIPCGQGHLTVIAACSANDFSMGVTEAQFLRAIMVVMALTLERAHAELVLIRNQPQILQAKHQWESALDALPQLVCTLDEDGRVLRVNRTLEAWDLGEVTSIRGRSVHNMLHPDCHDWNCSLRGHWEEMWRQLGDMPYAECEYQDISLERDLHCLLCRSAGSHYSDGNEEQGHVLLVVEDISRKTSVDRILADYNAELEDLVQERTRQLARVNTRLKAEIDMHRRDKEALREAEKKYTCLMDTTLTGYFVIQDGRIVYCNRRFAEIFGYSQDAISRIDMRRLFPADPLLDDANMERPWNTEERIVRGVTRDGDTVWLQRSLTRIDCLSETMTLGNVIDITAQKKVEKDLKCLRCDKKLLSEKLLTTQESERKHIAAELHDSIGQSVSAIKLGVENALREYGEAMPETARRYLQNASEKLHDTMEDVRRISMELRPPMLDDLGLLATVSWFCREYRALFPELDVKVNIDIEEREIPEPLKLAMFRILQEALNNIGKHATASCVSIEIARKETLASMVIQDDGQGFAVKDLPPGRGFGLGSMRERAKLSGGRLAIKSLPGAGTSVRAHWPI